MKTPVLFFNLLLLSSLFVGCGIFLPRLTHHNKLKASQWSDEDQTPGLKVVKMKRMRIVFHALKTQFLLP